MKIVSSIFPPKTIQAEVRLGFPDVHFEFFDDINNAKASLCEADVFITFGEDLTEEHIQNARNLKWIMVMSAGMEKMPLDACAKKGILITNARGVHKIPMAEFTLGTMLEHVKRRKVLLEREAEEDWDREVPIEELCGKTVLILGVGAIGGEIARLSKAFQMNTIGMNKTGNPVEYVDSLLPMHELNQVLPKADFIVSVLPSTEETKYLLKKEHFHLMKNSAVFINIGRGDLIKDEDIISSLKNKEIAHAYLDVFNLEPLPKGHPFWKMENVTVTAHLSSRTKNYLPRSFEIFKYNLHTYIKNNNDFQNKVDMERGY